jgi:hypothetical protein
MNYEPQTFKERVAAILIRWGFKLDPKIVSAWNPYHEHNHLNPPDKPIREDVA